MLADGVYRRAKRRGKQVRRVSFVPLALARPQSEQSKHELRHTGLPRLLCRHGISLVRSVEEGRHPRSGELVEPLLRDHVTRLIRLLDVAKVFELGDVLRVLDSVGSGCSIEEKRREERRVGEERKSGRGMNKVAREKIRKGGREDEPT